jgi:hypothetical protein
MRLKVMVLDLFVPGKVRTQVNGPQRNIGKKIRYRKTWRSNVQAKVLEAGYHLKNLKPDLKKWVILEARVFNLHDNDGLAAALKPVLDGLRDAQVIHDDSPRGGHQIEYCQVLDRKMEGVRIYVARERDL